MTRPEDIPEALWESREVLDIACKPVGARELVCRAILAAEKRVREECAKIAENDKAPYHGAPKSIARETAVSIAAAIRKGGEDASQRPMNPTASAGTGVHGARWQLVPADQDKGGEDA